MKSKDALANALRESFGADTLAHDAIKGKDLDSDEIEKIAENLVKIRKLAYALLSDLESKKIQDE